MNLRHILSRRLAAPFARFHRDEEASLSVEAVLVLPLLLWAFAASYAFFDIYRVRSLALKGNYAISDLLSRETEAIDQDYLDGMERVYRYLTSSDQNSWIRVTVVHCTANCDQDSRTLEADWSEATGGVATYSNADVMTKLNPLVPWMVQGQRVIVMESSMHYEPPLSQALVGLGQSTFFDTVLTRPRFSEQVCWTGINCGT